ncbi:hypothetical protein FRC20_008295 [Serendipita sp. 405]|nr:hypothetical protein FRC18_009060 [Serendipita sp. 400]KAG8830727.1 hypothetical protein FRC20_008295 [Serendipita sp. 405]
MLSGFTRLQAHPQWKYGYSYQPPLAAERRIARNMWLLSPSKLRRDSTPSLQAWDSVPPTYELFGSLTSVRSLRIIAWRGNSEDEPANRTVGWRHPASFSDSQRYWLRDSSLRRLATRPPLAHQSIGLTS